MSMLETSVQALMNYYSVIYPKQGSVEAMANRCKTIGCSEIHKVNHTKNSKMEVLKSKLGLTKSPKVVPLIWGHNFEDTCKVATELLFDCEILTAPGSIRSNDNYISCSPDGIGVVRVPHTYAKKKTIKLTDIPCKRLKYDFSKVVNFTDPIKQYERFRRINNSPSDRYSKLVDQIYFDAVALFEFKSPISRKLSGEIPQGYCYQVLAGLNVMSVCDIGIYSESRFVCCNRQQLDFDCKHVDMDTGKPDDSLEFYTIVPFMIGCKFYVFDGVPEDIRSLVNVHEVISKYDILQLNNNIEVTRDYYCIDCCFIRNDDYSSRSLLNKFYNILSKVMNVDFDQLSDAYWCFHNNRNIEPLLNLVKHKDIFAVQYWKLMDNQVAYFRPIEDFIDRNLEGAIDVINSVNLLSDRHDINNVIGQVKKSAGSRANIYDEIEKIIKNN